MMIHSQTEGMALEVASRIPDVLALADSHDGHISLVAMLRHAGIPYGIGQRIIDSMRAMRMIEPAPAPEFGYRLIRGAQ